MFVDGFVSNKETKDTFVFSSPCKDLMWNIPPDCSFLSIFCVGAGGGGGRGYWSAGVTATSSSGGGGGGAGAMSSVIIPKIFLPDCLYLTVGAGGAGANGAGSSIAVAGGNTFVSGISGTLGSGLTNDVANNFVAFAQGGSPGTNGTTSTGAAGAAGASWDTLGSYDYFWSSGALSEGVTNSPGTSGSIPPSRTTTGYIISGGGGGGCVFFSSPNYIVYEANTVEDWVHNLSGTTPSFIIYPVNPSSVSRNSDGSSTFKPFISLGGGGGSGPSANAGSFANAGFGAVGAGGGGGGGIQYNTTNLNRSGGDGGSGLIIITCW